MTQNPPLGSPPPGWEHSMITSLMGGLAPRRENDETTQSTVYVFKKKSFNRHPRIFPD